MARLITLALLLLGALPASAAAAVETVAGPDFGSSEPTYFNGNHRATVTAGGRMLTVHGRHQTGVQLAWRDDGGGWQRGSTGATSDGSLLAGQNTGDIPASIAVARDEAGDEHAWVVWGGVNSDSERAVQMRRLTELDSPGGPRVGPVVTVDAPPGGAYRADLGFERAVNGSQRGYLVWTRDAGGGMFELRTAWFDDLASETPTVNAGETLHTGTSSAVFGSVVPGPGGSAIVARAASKLALYAHDPEASAGDWSQAKVGPTIPRIAAPSGVALSNGDVLAAAQSAAGVTTVYRFEADDAFDLEPEIELTGYRQPTLAGNGTEAWLVAVRESDGRVVSRRRSGAGGTWDVGDRLEIGSEGGDHLAWPNAVRATDGRLRLVVEGDGSSINTSSVLAYERPLPVTPPPGNTDPPPGNTDSPPANTDSPPANTDSPPANTDSPPADADAPNGTGNADDQDRDRGSPRGVRCRVAAAGLSRNRRALRLRLTCRGTRAARSGRVRALLRRRGGGVAAHGRARMVRGRVRLRMGARKPLRRGRHQLRVRIGPAKVLWTLRVGRAVRVLRR